jgi:hypothetical protein
MMEGKRARMTNVSVQPCGAAVYAGRKIPAVAPAEINLCRAQSVPLHTTSPSKKCTPPLPLNRVISLSL